VERSGGMVLHSPTSLSLFAVQAPSVHSRRGLHTAAFPPLSLPSRPTNVADADELDPDPESDLVV